MKLNRIQYFSVVLAALASLTALPVKAQLTYSVNGDNTITITGYSGSPGNLIIPSSIAIITGYDTNNLPIYTTLPVTSIENNAFSLSSITSVVIPDNVTTIGDFAFLGCSSLTSVTVGNGVTYIGGEAFARCYSLSSLTMGNRVTSIGNEAFANDGNLETITIPNSVTSIGHSAFDACSGLTSVVIPNSVTNLGDSAFEDCSSLANVVISTNLTYLGTSDPASGGSVFYDCRSLTDIIIPNNVTSIGAYVFDNCSSLTNVTLSTNLTSICEAAFWQCSSLTSITIPRSVTNIGIFAFGSYYWLGCNLTRVYFEGNAPLVDGGVGSLDTSVFQNQAGTVYYLPGTTGWAATFGGWPTAWWYQFQPQPQILGSGNGLGMQSNGFQFTIFWVTNTAVVVEASTNLQSWTPVGTNTLVNGTNYFSDASSTNYPKRFYRVRSE